VGSSSSSRRRRRREKESIDELPLWGNEIKSQKAEKKTQHITRHFF